MFFNSLNYLFFLPLVALVLYLIPGRYQWLWLLSASIIFYYLLLPAYLILFFCLIILNYLLGIAIETAGDRNKSTFILSICINICILAFFKYFGFFQGLFSDIRELSAEDHLLKIILPVGLSFFIFTILSYLIEVKRGTVKAERHIGVFASGLLFFPKIMQGPIEKPGKIFPQFREAVSLDYSMISEGVKLIIWGYFKKLVVADRLAIYVNAVYNNHTQHSGITLLLATFLYSFQIYADFSGYTDIALGSAKVLGFNMTNNFKRPYFATSIKEFWNRWHITFSVWLRDYLFLPLAVVLTGLLKRPSYIGIAVEKWIFMVATLITFAICGLWHGEGLNYLIWGLLFGIYLTVANWSLGLNKRIRKVLNISKKSAFYKAYNVLVTFILISFAWIFFRAENASDALKIINGIFTKGGKLFFDYPTFLYGFIAIGLLVIIEFRGEKASSGTQLPFRTNHWVKEQLMYAGLAALIVLTGVLDGGQFIYFQY